MNLAKKIDSTPVCAGQAALVWLGQAGFLIKDAQGRQFVIDPYLSDCGERLKNFKRLTPKLLDPRDLNPDVLFASHHHFDHFDYDAVPVLAKHEKTIFIGPKSCRELFLSAGVLPERLRVLAPEDELTHNGIRITAVKADHGEMAPDALGAMVEMGGLTFYFSGDTSYHPEYAKAAAARRPDVTALSINGAFGNMTAEEGVLYAEGVGAALAVPCHFGTFVEHRGEPYIFVEKLNRGAQVKPLLMAQGELVIVEKDQSGRAVIAVRY